MDNVPFLFINILIITIMIKLSFERPKMVYVENISEPVTVASIKCKIIDNKSHEVLEEFTAKGKSKCHADDRYDKRFGTVMAISLAKRAAYKRAASLFKYASEKWYRSVTESRVNAQNFYNKMILYKDIEKADYQKMEETGRVPERKKSKKK